MTRRTKGHQIFIAVVAAFCQRHYMMPLLRFGKSAFFQTLLTKRVCVHACTCCEFFATIFRTFV
ncbi:MAG: hypothetical protein Q4E89_07205 [Eubacteriales bacterium]|nr:hypothetical protein [Eubacteriales bacterium]